MNEVWKAVDNYEGYYEVSNLGNVRSIDRKDSKSRMVKGRILKPNKYGSEYLWVNLAKDGKVKKCYIHRLVAIAFIPNPLNLSDVNHIDECKENNSENNLEWLSRKDNLNYGTHNQKMAKTKTGKKLSEEHKRKISESMKGKNKKKVE